MVCHLIRAFVFCSGRLLTLCNKAASTIVFVPLPMRFVNFIAYETKLQYYCFSGEFLSAFAAQICVTIVDWRNTVCCVCHSHHAIYLIVIKQYTSSDKVDNEMKSQ